MDSVATPVMKKARLFDGHLELLEAMPESAIMVDSSGLIVGTNLLLQNLFGYTRNELLGSPIEMVISESLRAQHIKARDQFIKSPCTQTMGSDKYIHGLHKSGKKIPVEIRLGPYLTNESDYIIALITDVSKRYRTQEHLKESENRLGVILNSVKAIPWVADPVTWEFTYVGSQAAEILGYPIERWYEKDFWVSKIHPDDRDSVIQICADCSKTHDNYELEYRMIASNDDVIWLQDIVNVERKNGELFIMRGFLIDITARKKQEQKLQDEKQFSDRLRSELAQVNRRATMGELTASIAHELNQPLAAIMSNAQAAQQFLKNEIPDIEEVKAALTDIASDDYRAVEIIKRLRKLFVKGQSENVRLNITELIVEVIKLIKNQARNKNISIVFENLASMVFIVMGDRIQLQQVVLNLMLNAIDAMDETVNRSRRLVIGVIRNGDDRLTVEFIDNGIGLGDQDVEQLFEAFYSSKLTGMGMGLAVSRTIIEAHGGHLKAVQNDAGGATFSFNLLLAPEELE